MKDSGGFTIVEVLIAISAFSVLLLVITYSYIFMSNSLFKGFINSQTQEVGRSLDQSIAQAINLNLGQIYKLQTLRTNNGTNIDGYCIGPIRYSYIISTKDSFYNVGSKSHVLVRDVISNCDNNTQPLDVTASLPNGGKELLGGNMYLKKFDISNLNSSTYGISLTIGYGNAFDCSSSPLGGGFCTSTNINTAAGEIVQ